MTMTNNADTKKLVKESGVKILALFVSFVSFSVLSCLSYIIMKQEVIYLSKYLTLQKISSPTLPAT